METVELEIDVTDAARLGEKASVAVTVCLPDPSTLRQSGPVVCFAKAGGGYAKGYYTISLPGPAHGAQAEWHTDRGWVFIALDHLGTGASSTYHEGWRLDFTTVAAANQAAEEEVLRRLAAGSVVDGFPPVRNPLRIGIGQSMGGCMTIIQQGRFRCYDGIGILGFSAVHTHPPAAPGQPPIPVPWVPRDTLLGDRMVVLNEHELLPPDTAAGSEAWTAMAWGFHYDDVDEATVRVDMARDGEMPPWASGTLPMAVAVGCLAPGAVAPEAAAVRVPVLVAMGERDVIADPRGEPRAYQSSRSVDLFVCPRMGHMHNFASTRHLLWQRLDTWASWVAVMTEHGLG